MELQVQLFVCFDRAAVRLDSKFQSIMKRAILASISLVTLLVVRADTKIWGRHGRFYAGNVGLIGSAVFTAERKMPRNHPGRLLFRAPFPALWSAPAPAQVQAWVREYRRGSGPFRGCRLVSNRADVARGAIAQIPPTDRRM